MSASTEKKNWSQLPVCDTISLGTFGVIIIIIKSDSFTSEPFLVQCQRHKLSDDVSIVWIKWKESQTVTLSACIFVHYFHHILTLWIIFLDCTAERCCSFHFSSCCLPSNFHTWELSCGDWEAWLLKWPKCTTVTCMMFYKSHALIFVCYNVQYVFHLKLILTVCLQK